MRIFDMKGSPVLVSISDVEGYYYPLWNSWKLNLNSIITSKINNVNDRIHIWKFQLALVHLSFYENR